VKQPWEIQPSFQGYPLLLELVLLAWRENQPSLVFHALVRRQLLAILASFQELLP